MLNECFGHGEVMLFHKHSENLFVPLRGLPFFLRGFQTLAELLGHLVECGDPTPFARGVLCEFIVQLGQLLFLDSLDIDRVVVSLPCEFGVGIIVWVVRSEALRFSRPRPAQVFGEALEGLFRAQMTQNVVGLDGIATSDRGARQLDKNVIAILCGAALHRNERRGTLPHLFEGFFYLRVADFNLIDLDLEVFVIAELEFRKDFKNRAEAQRLAFLAVDVIHFGASDRNKLLLIESLLKMLWDKRLKG